MTARLRAAAHVFRLEYVGAAAPGAFIPFFICAQSIDDITKPVVEGLVTALLLVFAGLGMNAIADRDIDRKYMSFKTDIAAGIDELGLVTTWTLVAAQLTTAVGLTICISWQMGSWLPVALVAVQIALSAGYSFPPLWFKVRGVAWHLTSLVLATAFIPFSLSAFTYLHALPPPIVTFMLGFSLVQYGWEFANQAVDFPEDLDAGLRTPAVRLGLVGALRAAVIVPAIGLAIEAGGAFWEIASRSEGGEGRVLRVVAIWLLAVLPMIAGWTPPARGIMRMRAVIATGGEAAAHRLADVIHYARWQSVSITGATCATAVIYWLAPK